MAMTYQQRTTPEIDALPGARGGAAEVGITLDQDSTTVRICMHDLALDAEPQVVSLDNDGDLYQLVSQKDLDHRSGTTIISRHKPVAAFVRYHH